MADDDGFPHQISIITLNCWGLKFISKLRHERLTEIARQLVAASPTPDLVALQECWTQADFSTVRRILRPLLPFAKLYFSGPFGSGLAFFSRWPIEGSCMFRYPLNGRPTAFFRGDWYVGKGVACARIRYGPGTKHILEVFNTHMHAPYEREPNDSYMCHRTAQAWEMAKLLRGAAERGHLAVALGDFNMTPMSLAHRVIEGHAPVRDVWRVMHPNSSLGSTGTAAEVKREMPCPNAKYNVLENGTTCDSVYNTWRWDPVQRKKLPTKMPDGKANESGVGKGPEPPAAVPLPVASDTPDPNGKRLDYIFSSTGDASALGGGWIVCRVAVGMTQRHPVLGCSLSDHFSVEATLAFEPVTTPSLTPDGKTDASLVSPPSSTPPLSHDSHGDEAHALHRATYLQSPTTDETPSTTTPLPPLHRDTLASATAQSHPSLLSPALPLTTYNQILAMIESYTAREHLQRTRRAAHFFFWLAALMACLIGVWWSPRNYVCFILMLVSSLGITAGVVDGLMALLFFPAELRALREFRWEVRNARAAAEGGTEGMRLWQQEVEGEDEPVGW